MNDQNRRHYIKKGFVAQAKKLTQEFYALLGDLSDRDGLTYSLSQLDEIRDCIGEAILHLNDKVNASAPNPDRQLNPVSIEPSILGCSAEKYLAREFPSTIGHIPLTQWLANVSNGFAELSRLRRVQNSLYWACDALANQSKCTCVEDGSGFNCAWCQSKAAMESAKEWHVKEQEGKL